MFNFIELLARVKSNESYFCGPNDFEFEGFFPYATSIAVLIIKIGVPILLIIIGMIDFAKAAMAQKEDEIKKGQGVFFKRLIAAILVFLVTTFVQLVVRFIANEEKANIANCIRCFIDGEAAEDACVPNGEVGDDYITQDVYNDLYDLLKDVKKSNAMTLDEIVAEFNFKKSDVEFQLKMLMEDEMVCKDSGKYYGKGCK